jgi:hypothetical protein
MTQMQSLSDSFLSGLNTTVWVITVTAVVLTLIAQVGGRFVRKEIDRRSHSMLKDAQKQAKDANDSVAIAKRNLETANTKIADLEIRAKPRQVTEQQKATIASILTGSAKGKVSITCPTDNSEAYSFAKQIALAIQGAQWEVTGPTTVTMFGSGPPWEGVKLLVRDRNNMPIWFETLVTALIQGGVDSRWRVFEPVPEGTAEIYVGPKPLSRPLVK